MTIKAIIIEDEDKIREVLDIKLRALCPEVSIVAHAENIENAYAQINLHNPDLIFLDIEMPGGTGFDLLARFEKIPFEVIITTGYNQYGLQALKISAVDYLLKPIKSEELQIAVKNAIVRIEETKKIKNYTLLKHNIKYLNDQRTKISVTHLGNIYYIAIKDIIHYESYEKYTYIYTTQKDKLFSTTNIGTYDDLLIPFGFCRCHKSHGINGRHIVEYYGKENTVKLSDESIVPIARRKKKQFEDFLKTCK